MLLRCICVILVLWSLVACVDKPSSLPPFEEQGFKAAIESGQSVVVHVYSTYCSPCHAQNDVLETLRKDASFQAVRFFHLDFDAQKETLKPFGVEEQSVILLFKDGKEKVRIDQTTDTETIRARLKEAL